MKININLFSILYGASKGFMNAFKACMNPFEAPERNVKKKLKIIFSPRPGL